VKLQFKGKTCANDMCSPPPDNLDKVWDTTLIRAMAYNWQTFVDDLEGGSQPTLPRPATKMTLSNELWEACHPLRRMAADAAFAYYD
jgi:hypothetical protein